MEEIEDQTRSSAHVREHSACSRVCLARLTELSDNNVDNNADDGIM